MKRASHLEEVIYLLSELVVEESYAFPDFLKKLIIVLSDIIPVGSCLIYFFDKEEEKLILCATNKTQKDAIGNVTMNIGEGITGWVAEHGELVVLEKEAYNDARFKFFKELPEDNYEAFLSVPIKDRSGVIGVINLQNKEPYPFTKEQIDLIQAVVRIISSAFASVVLHRKVTHLENKLSERKLVERAKGILMKRERMSENAAYSMIRKEAMKKRKSMREIAEAVILIYE